MQAVKELFVIRRFGRAAGRNRLFDNFSVFGPGFGHQGKIQRRRKEFQSCDVSETRVNPFGEFVFGFLNTGEIENFLRHAGNSVQIRTDILVSFFGHHGQHFEQTVFVFRFEAFFRSAVRFYDVAKSLVKTVADIPGIIIMLVIYVFRLVFCFNSASIGSGCSKSTRKISGNRKPRPKPARAKGCREKPAKASSLLFSGNSDAECQGLIGMRFQIKAPYPGIGVFAFAADVFRQQRNGIAEVLLEDDFGNLVFGVFKFYFNGKFANILAEGFVLVIFLKR